LSELQALHGFSRNQDSQAQRLASASHFAITAYNEWKEQDDVKKESLRAAIIDSSQRGATISRAGLAPLPPSASKTATTKAPQPPATANNHSTIATQPTRAKKAATTAAGSVSNNTSVNAEYDSGDDFRGGGDSNNGGGNGGGVVLRPVPELFDLSGCTWAAPATVRQLRDDLAQYVDTLQELLDDTAGRAARRLQVKSFVEDKRTEALVAREKALRIQPRDVARRFESLDLSACDIEVFDRTAALDLFSCSSSSGSSCDEGVLKQLNLSQNRLTELTYLPLGCEILDAASNSIAVTRLSAKYTALACLTLAGNCLQSYTDILMAAPNLLYLDVSYNFIAALEDVAPTAVLATHRALEELHVVGNPATLLPGFEAAARAAIATSPKLRGFNGQAMMDLADGANPAASSTATTAPSSSVPDPEEGQEQAVLRVLMSVDAIRNFSTLRREATQPERVLKEVRNEVLRSFRPLTAATTAGDLHSAVQDTINRGFGPALALAVAQNLPIAPPVGSVAAGAATTTGSSSAPPRKDRASGGAAGGAGGNAAANQQAAAAAAAAAAATAVMPENIALQRVAHWFKSVTIEPVAAASWLDSVASVPSIPALVADCDGVPISDGNATHQSGSTTVTPRGPANGGISPRAAAKGSMSSSSKTAVTANAKTAAAPSAAGALKTNAPKSDAIVTAPVDGRLVRKMMMPAQVKVGVAISSPAYQWVPLLPEVAAAVAAAGSSVGASASGAGPTGRLATPPPGGAAPAAAASPSKPRGGAAGAAAAAAAAASVPSLAIAAALTAAANGATAVSDEPKVTTELAVGWASLDVAGMAEGRNTLRTRNAPVAVDRGSWLVVRERIAAILRTLRETRILAERDAALLVEGGGAQLAALAASAQPIVPQAAALVNALLPAGTMGVGGAATGNLAATGAGGAASPAVSAQRTGRAAGAPAAGGAAGGRNATLTAPPLAVADVDPETRVTVSVPLPAEYKARVEELLKRLAIECLQLRLLEGVCGEISTVRAYSDVTAVDPEIPAATAMNVPIPGAPAMAPAIGGAASQTLQLPAAVGASMPTTSITVDATLSQPAPPPPPPVDAAAVAAAAAEAEAVATAAAAAAAAAANRNSSSIKSPRGAPANKKR
jgi:hypothetical protein